MQSCHAVNLKACLKGPNMNVPIQYSKSVNVHSKPVLINIDNFKLFAQKEEKNQSVKHSCPKKYICSTFSKAKTFYTSQYSMLSNFFNQVLNCSKTFHNLSWVKHTQFDAVIPLIMCVQRDFHLSRCMFINIELGTLLSLYNIGGSSILNHC